MTDGIAEEVSGFDDLEEGESLRELLGDRPLEQPIELLVQLADDGEIDPWDLDLLAVTDAFLDRIDEADLVVTARTLFYASVLLRMKSDAIVGEQPDPTEELPPEPYEEPDGDPVAVLEAEMDRRLTRKRARGTPTTLAQLIRELRSAERDRFWKESRSYDTSGERRRGPQTLDYRDIGEGHTPGDAVQQVSDTPHHENLEGVLIPLLEHLEERFETTPSVAFESVIHLGPSPARVYTALVFLEHRGAIRLRQDQLYEPLSVETGPKGLEAGYNSRSVDTESIDD